MSNIATVTNELDTLKKSYDSKVIELYQNYIDYIKQTITEYSFSHCGHEALYNEIVKSVYLNNIQKGLILSVLIHLTDQHEYKTLSLLLKSYVDLTNEVLDKNEDTNLTLRPVFEVINDKIRDISFSGERYAGNLLFSFKDGIQIDDISELVTRYSLYVSSPIFLSAASGLTFHEGEIFLNSNTLITAKIYELVREEFRRNPELTSTSFWTRRKEYCFTFFRNTLDVEVRVQGNSSPSMHRFTLENVKNTNHENMNDALKNIEKIKETINLGFDAESAPHILTASYSIFIDGVCKKLSGKPVSNGDPQIKSFMNITQDNG